MTDTSTAILIPPVAAGANGQPEGKPVAGARPVTVMQVTWSLVAGGSEMFAFKIAAGLDRRRFRSVMCAVDQGGALEPEIEQLSIPYHVLHRRHGPDPRLCWRLGRLIQQHRVDVVHTHHFNQLLYAAPAAKLLGARLIHTEHSVEWVARPRLRLAFRNLARLCHQVIAVGTEVADALRHRVGVPPSRLTILRAGVDPAAFECSRADARWQLAVGEHERVATIVARLYPEKNHANLLAAFAQVIRRLPNTKLLIVGAGIAGDAIRREIEARGLHAGVRLLGVRRDIPQILAATDVFVLSSDREGLPIAVLEAMAAGRPVVATAVGDLPLVVQDGVTGRLVPPRNPDALGDALTELLAYPARAAALGAKGREFVTREYSEQRMIEQHAAAYTE